MDYSKLNAAELNDIVAAEHPDAWGAAAKAWGKTAVLANNVEAGISSASGEITVWRQSNDSAAQAAFDQRINRDLDVLRRWNQFGVIVMLRLQAVASVLGAAQPAIRGFADARAEQVRIRDAAADDIDARNRATQEIDRLDDLARGRMQLVAQLMRESLTDKDPERPGRWVGPRAAPGGPSNPGADDGSQAPGAQGPGADSGGGGAAPGDPDAGTPEQPSSPKTPEAKDPVEEAGKLIDVIGKGIDLTGKVPENLDKWLTLAQHAKDLLGADTPSTSTPDSLVPQGLPTDEPALAGGAGSEQYSLALRAGADGFLTREADPALSSRQSGENGDGGRRPVLDVQFAEDAFDVLLNRARRDVQNHPDFNVGFSLCYPEGDLRFAFGHRFTASEAGRQLNGRTTSRFE